jgi:flagellar P-ring protein precursor FlgI
MVITLLVSCGTGAAHAVRIKDIADIKGVRSNQLVGYGLVVGLNGSGDGNNATFTSQSMSSMLEKMGITINSEGIDVDNVAAVMVTAELPPFVKAGSRIDVVVSSIGDASSLYGGTLLLSPLKAPDGNVYAVAQGPVSIGGFSAGGSSAKIQKNFPTVGRIVGGALIEKEITAGFTNRNEISLNLHNPDFTTISRMAEVINKALNNDLARTIDAGTVVVNVPSDFRGSVVGLVSAIEGLDVSTDTVAKVVVNERTGTVVMGQDVRISTIAMAHGNLSIEVKESADVSQPMPFSDGETVAVPSTEINVSEEKAKLFLMQSGVTLGEVVRALNALGVSPRDLITIFQAMKASGALKARLEVM